MIDLRIANISIAAASAGQARAPAAAGERAVQTAAGHHRGRRLLPAHFKQTSVSALGRLVKRGKRARVVGVLGHLREAK